MSESFVSVSRNGAVGVLTLNRPPANSYDLDFVHAFAASIEQVANDVGVRAIVVKSNLPKFYSAGADVKFFSSSTMDGKMELIRAEHATLEQVERIPKIFIAMIAGHALGGGLELALACDLRFAGDGDYRIGLPEVTLGLLPGNGGTQRLARLIGKSRALDLMIQGKAISPREALELGVVNHVFPQAELEAKTMEYAQKIALGASFAIGRIKLAVNQGTELPLAEGLALERKVIEEVFESADAREGIAAFTEKRAPTFKGE